MLRVLLAELRLQLGFVILLIVFSVGLMVGAVGALITSGPPPGEAQEAMMFLYMPLIMPLFISFLIAQKMLQTQQMEQRRRLLMALPLSANEVFLLPSLVSVAAFLPVLLLQIPLFVFYLSQGLAVQPWLVLSSTSLWLIGTMMVYFARQGTFEHPYLKYFYLIPTLVLVAFYVAFMNQSAVAARILVSIGSFPVSLLLLVCALFLMFLDRERWRRLHARGLLVKSLG